MAKKRKSARKKASNPKKRRHKRAHARKAVANPKRRHKRAAARSRASNPRRRHKRHAARARSSNPGFGKRRHRRRNPGKSSGGFGIKQFGIGALGAFAAFLGTLAVDYYVTDDQVQNGVRNRAIIGSLLTALGVGAAMKGHKAIGVGAALGGILAAFGPLATVKMYQLLPAKGASTTSALQLDAMQAIAVDNMRGVYNPPMMGMGAYEAIGDVTPPAPWAVPNPFA